MQKFFYRGQAYKENSLNYTAQPDLANYGSKK